MILLVIPIGMIHVSWVDNGSLKLEIGPFIATWDEISRELWTSTTVLALRMTFNGKGHMTH